MPTLAAPPRSPQSSELQGQTVCDVKAEQEHIVLDVVAEPGDTEDEIPGRDQQDEKPPPVQQICTSKPAEPKPTALVPYTEKKSPNTSSSPQPTPDDKKADFFGLLNEIHGTIIGLDGYRPFLVAKYLPLQCLRLGAALSFLVVAYALVQRKSGSSTEFDLVNLDTVERTAFLFVGIFNLLGRLAPFLVNLYIDRLKECLQVVEHLLKAHEDCGLLSSHIAPFSILLSSFVVGPLWFPLCRQASRCSSSVEQVVVSCP